MTIRWGLLATGNIARSMAEALALVTGLDRYAVASRDLAKARAFADEFGFAKGFGSYGELLADPEVDVVYIATPNALHKDNILACLDAGKHVLCEKPMTTSAADTALCAAAARARGLFLMEAMWSRFLPAMVAARRAIEAGRIGTPYLFRASFVSWRDPADWPNLYSKALGGGALLDLGVYPLTVGQYLVGDIAEVSAQTRLGPGGVDVLSTINARFANGALGQLACGFVGEVERTAEVRGDSGVIRITPPFNCPTSFEVESAGRVERVEEEPAGQGYAHQVEEVQRCLGLGLTESPAMPLDHSLATARILEDLVRCAV